MPLIHFLLAKAALAHLPTALLVALRPLFPFQQAQYVQVFPLEPAPYCKLFAGPLRNLMKIERDLVFATTGKAFCQAIFSLGLAELKILLAAPVDSSHLILHCPATEYLRRLLFVSLRPLDIFCYAPIPPK